MESSITSTTEEINDRQKDLIGDYSGNTAIIAGLGGVGNWVALDLALIGFGSLILYDPDRIETSNLNRTLFKVSHIGEYKTKAVRELISERRKDTIIITQEEYFTEEHLQKFKGFDYFFDCTDTTRLKDSLANSAEFSTKYIKLGYDGFEGTLCINDFNSGQWGEDDSSYTVVPSFFGTPQVISALGITDILLNRKSYNRTVNLNVKTLLNNLTPQT